MQRKPPKKLSPADDRPPAPSAAPERHRYASGAQRDALPRAWDTVCPTALRLLVETCAHGDQKYGVLNYAHGMPSATTLGHVLDHLNQYRAGDRTEPHIEHAFCGLMMLLHQLYHCRHHQVYLQMQQEDQRYADGAGRDANLLER